MPVGPVARDHDTAEFFDAAAAGTFLLRWCEPCQAALAPQARQCERCGTTRLGWRPAAGGASLVSWTVVHSKPDAVGDAQTQVLVIAEFDEGPWWWSQLSGADPAALRAGTRLRVAFERAGEEFEHVPVFRLADALPGRAAG